MSPWYSQSRRPLDKVTFHTDQKSGTGIAATQQETPYTATYTFKTDCSSGTCIARVVDGPTPKDTVSQSVTFEWTGSQWTRSAGWKWDCLLPGGTITYDPAESTISSGACQGTVSIPVTAVKA